VDKKSARAEIRKRRRSLSIRQQRNAAEALAARVALTSEFRNARSVALYLGNDGEIDPLPLLALAEATGKTCLLPVLHPLKLNRIHFLPYKSGDVLGVSYFGYPEPKLKSSRITPPWAIDLILMPLVGFDRFGGRLGMGGGFYDRTLAFTLTAPKRPKLIGLAHSCQELERINMDPWDIPVDAIATEKRLIRCK